MISGQILKRDIKIAQYLSREVQEPLLVNNKLVLRLLLEDRLESLGDIIYIFIRARDESIIVSTFQKGFPKGLLRINEKISELQKPGEDTYSVEKFLVDGKRVYDIAIPLLKGELGSLHVGVSLESSKTEIATFYKIKYYVAIVIFIGLGVGILIFSFLGIFLTSRIIKLKNFAIRISQGDLDGSIDVKSDDEIGALAKAFNEMAISLKEKIQEVSRLNIIKERDRIAFDLHDNCAQDLANLIKRLELCEKLFKIEPVKAFEELNVLKENIRGHLCKARQVIRGLKSPEDEDFLLLEKISEYIKDYEQYNDITVKLDISESINNIPADKSTHIFYIITESLINIRKHAQARNVNLSLDYDVPNELSIKIKDDGIGFDAEETGLSTSTCGKWGLMSIRQRVASLGGNLTINSIPKQGTEILVRIPFRRIEYNI
jgi:signal transduction histidine kinase